MKQTLRPYLGRQASLATRHAKEQAVALPMRFELGLELAVPPDLDTDALGTFCGEVARQGTPAQVSLRKARLGMAATGLPLGVANEGSFGPHPIMPCVATDLEMMTFVDDERGLVVTETLLSESTNYGHREARSADELTAWLTTVGFPSHALIVRPKSGAPGVPAEKGIVSIKQLESAVERMAGISPDAIAWVETDMRAHHNPTRMAVIQQLAFRLARRLATTCPACATPGWGRTGVVDGLPCELCDEATSMTRCEVFGCVVCAYREDRPRGDRRQTAPPQYCPECNP